MTLSTDQRRAYDEQGYILIPGLLSLEEAARYRAEVHALDARQGLTNATWASVAGDTRLAHSHDVQFKSAAFTRLLVDPRLTGVAQAIIGPNVQLHHTKMFIKPPERGSPFPMHQDYPYFPHRDHSMIAVILFFDDAPVEKGCVTAYPGSHKLGPLAAYGSDHHVDPARFPAQGATPIPARAGDALFFHYLLVHGSGVNTASEARTTLLVQLRDPADQQLNQGHASRGQGMMIAGIDPGVQGFRFAWEGAA
ncbi:phytanoyl-CoA dioxygenase family protein [Sphingomonas sp.]|uniref:phytanoyl-CoA dioxygenase family protein n=1 Tax=Sphingomonas sp. TaxID=28214 RepID=UPI001D412DCF|nr:phytanoyl-CoA dioxygenase family protein [Sphingomonas sp.]MBX9796934.1 phytanoyl-CoA dioxygenase family protein [Sphingomonas sp.]